MLLSPSPELLVVAYEHYLMMGRGEKKPPVVNSTFETAPEYMSPEDGCRWEGFSGTM